MRTLFPIIFAIVLIAIFGVAQLVFFKFFNRRWWEKKTIRRAAWALPLLGAVSVILWGYGEYTRRDWLAYPGAITAVLAFILEVGLTLSLPVSGIFHFVNWLFDKLGGKRPKRAEPPIDRHRRRFIQASAAAFPLAALALGGGGVIAAQSGVRVHRKVISIDNLPEGLDGLRILHISDVHLRHYVTLDDLVEVTTMAETYRPDLTLVTGDVADDVRVLPDALKLLGELRPPLGTYGCLGNHEYFRGIGDVLAAFEAASTPLFINDGVRLTRGTSSLFVGGLDDPRFMRSRSDDFFARCLDITLRGTAAEDFVILMSHRPAALDDAAVRGVSLILAGHTHGGQVGMNHRSLFESVLPDRYLWGHYRMKQSHLYTSSGVGHWFPFRLGCPPEAPVIELQRTRFSL